MSALLHNSYRAVVLADRCETKYANHRISNAVKHAHKNLIFRMLPLLIAAIAICALCMPRMAISAVPEKYVTYTVRPGDTLWSYAEAITPRDGDISDNVERLILLNHLSSSDLEIGQSINVPVVDAR